ACKEMNRINPASIELPFRRLEHDQQPVLITHKGYSQLTLRTAHGAALELLCLEGRCDCPRTNGDGLVIARWRRLSDARRGGELAVRACNLGWGWRRLTHIPLANSRSMSPFKTVEMNVVIVIAVGAGAQHRGKAVTGRNPQHLTNRLGDVFIGELGVTVAGENQST